MIQQVPVNPHAVELLQMLLLAPNEGVMLVKFVLLKQDTLKEGQAQSKIDSAPSVILLGNLDEIKTTLVGWLNEAVEQYKKV